jgi:cellulose synthase/poly-beta-1,6-N-acetylglucosamine synthase-like glycosyltransferase
MNADWLRAVLVVANGALLAYFVALNTWHVALLAGASSDLHRRRRLGWHDQRRRLLQSTTAPRVSVLAPAFNEGVTVVESVGSLLRLNYPQLEVVLINDGSADQTLEALARAFRLVPVHTIYQRVVSHQPIVQIYRSPIEPALIVIDKVNGGKADALNAGLNVASGELVCAIDADTLIERDALMWMVGPFIERDDVVAAGGTIRIANGCVVRNGAVVDVRAPRRPLVGFQVIEYLRAFLFGRLGWNRLGGNLIISGAFGVFRRARTLQVGGYEHATVGEDMELVARLRRAGLDDGGPSRVEFIPDPVAWTEVPESARTLGRQRDRWQRGLADVLWRQRGVILRPRYRALGLVLLPYFVLVELAAPLVELAAFLCLTTSLALGAVDVAFALTFLLVAYGLGLLVSMASLGLEELGFRRYERLTDRVWLCIWAVLEPLGYRQLTVWWRVRGMVKFARGRKDWGTMERRGFGTEPTVDDTVTV